MKFVGNSLTVASEATTLRLRCHKRAARSPCLSDSTAPAPKGARFVDLPTGAHLGACDVPTSSFKTAGRDRLLRAAIRRRLCVHAHGHDLLRLPDSRGAPEPTRTGHVGDGPRGDGATDGGADGP